MKNKKIFLFLIVLFSFFYIGNVKAAEDDACTTTPYMSSLYNGKSVAIPLVHRGYARVWYFSVHGKTAFCMDEGLHMNGRTKISDSDCTLTRATKQALEFCARHSCGPSGAGARNYLIAQLYAWEPSMSRNDALNTYCSLVSDTSIDKMKCRSGTTADFAVIDYVFNSIKSMPALSDDEYVCYRKTDNDSGFQRLGAKKPSNKTCKDVCPDDTEKAGLDISDCIKSGKTKNKCIDELCGADVLRRTCEGYSYNKTGGLPTCSDNNGGSTGTFSEIVGVKSSAYTGSSTGGNKVEEIGRYGALYCYETAADVNMPGGVANPITIGSSLVWPTSNASSDSPFGNMYPLTFQGHMKCKLQVAPNLTYSNKCELKPIDEFEEQVKQLHRKYNSRNTIKKGNGDQGGQPNVSLSLTNEEIRYNYGSCRTKTESGCADSNYYSPLNTWANNNYNYWSRKTSDTLSACRNNRRPAANATEKYIYNPNYDSRFPVSDTNPVTIPTGKYTYDCNGIGTLTNGTQCIPNESWCYNNDGAYRTAKDNRDSWSTTKSNISSSKSNFDSYASTYSKTVEIYSQIKLIADYAVNCGGNSCSVYQFQSGADVSYTDENPGYGATYSLTPANQLNYSCSGCSDAIAMYKEQEIYPMKFLNFYVDIDRDYLQDKIDKVEAKAILIETNEVEYKLPDGLYNYLNKDTLEYSNWKPNDRNYIKLNYSNLPTSFNNKVGRKYDLILENIYLGHNGQFNSGTLNRAMNYICHYQVATDTGECLCPPGTKHDGADLYQVLLNGNGSLTCADAKLRYCNADNVPECTTNCVEEKYCPNDRSIKITGCVNSGKPLSTCVNLLCGSKYYCDNNTQLAGMDMTTCVQTRVAQGHSINSAKRYCNDNFCSNRNMFVYRTIDLKNPFPSIDADKSVSQNNLRYGMFNLNVRGRYPGYNWNGVNIVKSEIIQNRNTNDYNIYNKTPLYHFELDTSTILEIREYNKKQAQYDDGYNDFTLSCVQDENNRYLGAACLSRFVHDIKYGGDTTGSKSLCGGAGTTTTLANCLYTASNS